MEVRPSRKSSWSDGISPWWWSDRFQDSRQVRLQEGTNQREAVLLLATPSIQTVTHDELGLLAQSLSISSWEWTFSQSRIKETAWNTGFSQEPLSRSFVIKIVFRILLLDINDTNAEDHDNFDIIVTGTMADIVVGRLYLLGRTGPSSEIWPTVANRSAIERAKPTSKGAWGEKCFSSDHFKEDRSETAPKRSSVSVVRIPLIKFCNLLKS